VPWTFEEIERDWFGDAHLAWDRDDVLEAFNLAERIRGRDWVLGREMDPGFLAAFPNIGKRGGYQEFLRVYWFGRRLASIVGAAGADDLIGRLIENDPSASEEAAAIHLLRSRNRDTELEIGPTIAVGDHTRQPDFRIRKATDSWIYVEVTTLNESTASMRIQRLLQRISAGVIAVEQPFLLEILFNRDPSAEEEEEILSTARVACGAADGTRKDVTDVASILVKAGEPSVVVPTLIEDDNRPRMAIASAIVGPAHPNRQMVARIPFQDLRAEQILKIEARQLPRHECGIVMANVNRQPTAFESWSQRVPERFTAGQHTRVAGVILFTHATTLTSKGLVWIPSVRMIANPHAARPLPSWVADTIGAFREESRRLTERSD
jgi:hypothetical protein